MELIEAAATHGDEVMSLAVKASPAARRVFALNAESLLPLARRYGHEVLELEAKAPGLGERAFTVFGEQDAKLVAAKMGIPAMSRSPPGTLRS